MKNNCTITKGIERMLGFEKYQRIMDSLQHTDISTDTEFQKTFNDYYQVRRNEAWRKGYYEYFQEIKGNGNITFESIIDHLFITLATNKGKEHPVEASFSSKMLATVNPRMPILDSQVLTNMGLSIDGKTPEEKLSCAKVVYAKICEKYRKYVGTKNCNKVVALFDSYFPDYMGVSAERKIDWFLWGFSKEELISIGLFGELL